MQKKISLFVVLIALATAGFAQGVAAPGFAVSNFATGFTTDGRLGPIGVAFDSQGNLYVGNLVDGTIHKFGPTGGIANASTLLNSPPIPELAGLAFTSDGRFYGVSQVGNLLELNPADGSIIRIAASGMPIATGLATDPLSGDLFVSDQIGNIFRVSGLASGPGAVTHYFTGDIDGISFGADGSLFGASRDTESPIKVTGTNQPQPAVATVIQAVVPGLDGISVSADPNMPFLYVNSNFGVITRIDLSVTPPALSNIFTGGTRGDFSAVGPDGCLYATQTASVIKLTNADGSCIPPPLGPLTPTTPAATFQFAAFKAEVEVKTAQNRFEVEGSFTLAANSDGVNPATEDLTLSLGSVTLKIPKGSFHLGATGTFGFEGNINGQKVEASITPGTQPGSFSFEVEVNGPDPTGGQNPVPVSLTIGNDTGSTKAKVEFKKS
jgi:hypothetical protein